MPKTRVFISSTCYDLSQVRADLENFIHTMNYESVRNEKGNIPYSTNQELEKYCYKEISACEIVLHIIGGRFGSTSTLSENYGKEYSVSQMEMKKAHEANKQIYIFIDRKVLTEYQTYLNNKENDAFKPSHVDDKKVFSFIEDIYNYQKNNNIQEFSTAQDIITYLKEQWSGLFQRFLQEESKAEGERIENNLKIATENLTDLYERLNNRISKEYDFFKMSPYLFHPLAHELQKKLKLDYRPIFLNRIGFTSFLNDIGFKVCSSFTDDYDYFRIENGEKQEITLKETTLFEENGDLKLINPFKNSDLLVYEIKESLIKPDTDDDMPF